jgi:PDDEXK-like uncharacterized protein DUF3799
MVRPRRIRKAGIYDLTAAEYHGDPCARPSLSRTIAQKLVDQSAAHAWTAHSRYGDKPDPEDDTASMDLGSAVHAAFLQDENLIVELPFDSWRSEVAQARRNAVRASGKIPLLTSKVEAVFGMIDALYQFRARTGAFTAGKPEQTIIWKEGPIYCRSRVDWLPDDPTADLWDLKVTGGVASAATWRRRAEEVAADIQAVMYPRGSGVVRGKPPRGMKFAVVEEKRPHGIKTFFFTGEALEIASAKFSRAVELWTECQAGGAWPNYVDEPEPLEATYAGRVEWAALTETMQGLGRANFAQQREKDEAAVGKMAEQGQWGG